MLLFFDTIILEYEGLLMNGPIKITLNNDTIEMHPIGVTFLELSKNYQRYMKNKIIGAKVNNVYHSLDEKITKSCKIDFVDITDPDGYTMYKSGLKFVLYVAIKELFGKEAEVVFYNSIDKGAYVRVICEENISERLVQKIKSKMQEIIDADYPITRQWIKKRDIIDYYNKVGEDEKALNAETSTDMTLSLFKLKTYFNYFYTTMPSSTGVLELFDITIIDKQHIVLRYPTSTSNGKIPDYNHY